MAIVSQSRDLARGVMLCNLMHRFVRNDSVN